MNHKYRIYDPCEWIVQPRRGGDPHSGNCCSEVTGCQARPSLWSGWCLISETSDAFFWNSLNLVLMPLMLSLSALEAVARRMYQEWPSWASPTALPETVLLFPSVFKSTNRIRKVVQWPKWHNRVTWGLSLDPHGRKTEPVPTSYPLTSTDILMHKLISACTYKAKCK